jgi:7,8-dihydropterin-6-yl-methyl-4-(beta-D-ribofuranosyl)aminobenzene 5'-phosphate synthase
MNRQTLAVGLSTALLFGWLQSTCAHADNAITVLYDAFGLPSDMQKDWGFSALVEYNGTRVLFDTGNNAEIFAHNVKAKGIDLTDLDFAVISHRHGDHIGGLSHLVSVNPTVQMYAPKEGFGVFGAALPGTFYRRNEELPPEKRYFDGNPPQTLRFGSAWPNANITWISETTEVAPGFHIIALKGDWGADLPLVELSLAIDTPNGIVLIVGCSHPRIENIVEAAHAALNRPIYLVIGGTHLLPATDDEIKRIAATLHDTWKVAWIAPAHCTGEPAFEILKNTFGNRYIYAGLGTTIELGPTPRAAQAYVPSGVDQRTDLETYRALANAAHGQHDHDPPPRMVAAFHP